MPEQPEDDGDVIIVEAERPQEIEAFIEMIIEQNWPSLTVPQWQLPSLQSPSIKSDPEQAEAEDAPIKPSPGQEDFADDGDPFNDGEPPTEQTIIAWLEELIAEGEIDSYVLNDLGDDDDTTYRGSYETAVETTIIFSDGDLYGQYPSTPADPLPDDFDVTYLPPDGFDFGFA